MSLRPGSMLLLAAAALTAAPTVAAGDAAAAERQYRVARRLAAEGSAEASAALRKVVELDPEGPLVDDALVEQARLRAVATWPERTGWIEPGPAREALALLDKVLAGDSRADRISEAQYLRAMIRLEPSGMLDLSAARNDLIAVATTGDGSEWAFRARYALGAVYENGRENERAAAAYQRVLVDDPQGPAAGRARVGLARLRLLAGDPGEAAALLQAAVDGDVAEETLALPLRELAIRLLLRGARSGGALEAPDRFAAGVRGPSSMVATARGGVLVASRREGRVVELDRRGARIGAWTLAGVQTLAIDPRGRAFAAAGEAVHRLHPDGRSVVVASQGEFAPASALAADAAGGFWVVDRRGQSIGRIEPGAGAPVELWSGRGSRVVAVAWNGKHLVAADVRAKAVIAIRADGSWRALVEGLERPSALAADPSGRIAVLDAKGGRVQLVGSSGGVLDVYECAADGITRPTAIGLGWDGVLHLLDDAEDGSWVRLP